MSQDIALNLHKNNSIKLKGYVDGQSAICLVDSGASTTFMSKSFLESLNRNGTHLSTSELAKPCDIILGNNITTRAITMAYLPLTIEESVFPIKALLLESLPFDVVLGMDFLKTYNTVIDVPNDKIQLDPEPCNTNRDIYDNNVLLDEDCELPAGCETIVNVKSNNSDGGLSFIKTSEILAERELVYVAKGLVEFKQKKSQVVIGNLGRQNISLPKGTIIATLELVKDENYLTIMELTSTAKETNTTSQKYKTNTTLSSEEKLKESAEDTEEEEGFPNDLDLSGTNCSKLELKLLRKLITKYSRCFAKNPKSPDSAKGVEHTIDTGVARPINCAPYRASPAQREAIEQQINEMFKNKIIEPSRSPWAAPIVLVIKKDGSIRFCLDYRKLNSVTKRDVYPLPRIDDCLNALGGCKYFSTFDLAAGYWQIPMNPDDKEKTAFISHYGLYHFNVMSFGLTNAPATFQRFMDRCFSGLKWRSLLVYLDDIIVFSVDFENHLIDLEEVFRRIQEHGLTFKVFSL